jgi:hypothetical protein
MEVGQRADAARLHAELAAQSRDNPSRMFPELVISRPSVFLLCSRGFRRDTAYLPGCVMLVTRSNRAVVRRDWRWGEGLWLLASGQI